MRGISQITLGAVYVWAHPKYCKFQRLAPLSDEFNNISQKYFLWCSWHWKLSRLFLLSISDRKKMNTERKWKWRPASRGKTGWCWIREWWFTNYESTQILAWDFEIFLPRWAQQKFQNHVHSPWMSSSEILQIRKVAPSPGLSSYVHGPH